MITRFKSFAAVAFAGLLFTASLSAADDIGQLQQSFDQPPDNARIMVRWWWFGPAATKPEIEREMTVMKQGGIGGFEATSSYPLALNGTLPGLTNYGLLSPEHLDALRFAAAKAKQLGLRMDLTLASGWPYGGPEITRSNAADAIHESAPVTVSSGQKSVAMPSTRSRRGDGNDEIIAALLGPVPNAPVDSSYLPLKIHGRAALLPDDLRGATQVTFYTLAHPNLVYVKRAAVGGEGYIVDHYSPTAIDTFIKDVAEPEVKACGPNPPYAIFCDSLEVSGENWTPNFLAEFKKRRGYDLTPLLPALFDDLGPKTADIRQDWAQTVTEIFNDYFVKGLTTFAHENNSRFRIQAYGTPPATLFSYADCDLPEGELGGANNEKNWSATRWASSASHLLGKPVTSSETFTWIHSPVFRATPLDMKAEANLHFLCGINQIICHGWPYTAPGAPYPGWSFYAAGVFDEKNPWWIVMPDVAKYLQRVSSILRQGEPVNDVALYMPNSDAWASLGDNFSVTAALQDRVSGSVRAITDAGYDLDFFDDQFLATRGKVAEVLDGGLRKIGDVPQSGGVLEFGSMHYRAVVLPGVERIPLATMKTLEEFARRGGIVIASQRLPDLAPGYKTPAADTQAVRDIVQRLFKDPGAPGIFVNDDSQIGAALAKRLQPDVAFSSAADQIGEVHRHTDAGEVYFIANTDNQPHNVQATFRVAGLQAEIWNPMDGSVRPANVTGKSDDSTTVQLDLPPYDSTLVVFTKRSLPSPVLPPAPAGVPPPVDLNSGWTVRFGTNGAPITMDTLASWTTLADEANFSGVATYEKTVTVAPEMLQNGLSLSLDFGKGKPTQDEGHGVRADLDAPIREAAIVYINGRRAGSIWCPPYSMDVTGKLMAGENQIRIEVANLAVNYMAGAQFPNYDYEGLTRKYGNRFQPQNLDEIKPLPSGLIGPVQLVASATVR